MNQNCDEKIVHALGLVSRRVWPAWLILAAAIILTILVTLYTKSDVDVQAKREFQFASNEIRGKIDDRLAAHEQILLSGAALFDASGQVTREEWRTFTQRLNVESNFPGIQGIGFALRIPPDRLAQHVQEMRIEGFPDYNVRPEGDRDAYSSIIYLEPFLGRNLRAFGYDMLSEPVRRAAMERARDQNEAALSGEVVLAQETEKDIQAGTLMYVPVYRRGMPTETVEQRREALFGWVYSPYRMTDLMSGILGGWDSLGGLRIRLQVYDGTRLSPDSILYDSQPSKDMGPAPQFTEELQVIFNGSPWTLRFIQAGGQVSHAKVWFTLAGGMTISLLLFGITLSLINSRFNAGQMAERLTAELRESEVFLSQSEKIGGIGGWKANPFTNTLRWTQGVYDILDAPKDYRPGLDAGLEFYTPAYRPIIKEAIAKTLEHGEPFKIEAEVITTGGKLLWTEVRGLKRVEEGEGPEIIGSFLDITERKLTEEALRETQENFRSFFETMDDIIIVGEPDGKIIYSNLALSRKLGYTPEELKTMHVLDLHPVEKRQEAERIFAEMFRGERDACPLPLAKKDGVYFPVETRVWFGKWSGKDCIFGLSKDLSKEQAALQKFNRLFNGNPAPMAVSSLPERKFTEVNDAFLTTMGFARDEVVGKTSVELGLFPEPEIQSHVALALQDEGSVRNVEMKVRKKDGTIADGLFFGEIMDNQGHKNLLSVMVDITQRKRAEKELAQKQALLQGLLESIPDIVFFKDINGVYLGCNSEFALFVGRDEKEIIGHTDYALFGKDVADLFRENDRLMMAQGVARHNEEWIDYPDGRRVLIDTIKAPLRSINGDTIGVLGVSRDVTDLKIAEQKLLELNENLEKRVTERSGELVVADRQLLTEIQEHADTASSLRDSEKSVRVIIESSPIGIFVIQNQEYIFANQAFIKIFGLTDSSEIIGKHPETPYSNDSWKIIGHIIRECVKKSELIKENELKLFTRNHRERHLNIWLQPTEFSGSPAIIGFMIDVSEELEIRSHLNQSQKMEALGSLAGGIAHDFNNVLFAITGNTELAQISAPADSKLNGQLEQILRAARRAADLVKHILTFSRERELEKKPLLIAPIVKESLNFLRASITQNIEIQSNIRVGLHTVNADPTQIHQIIMNLVTNAYHAMKDTGGTLDVSLEEVELSDCQ